MCVKSTILANETALTSVLREFEYIMAYRVGRMGESNVDLFGRCLVFVQLSHSRCTTDAALPMIEKNLLGEQM